MVAGIIGVIFGAALMRYVGQAKTGFSDAKTREPETSTNGGQALEDERPLAPPTLQRVVG